jgi:hypothetical protein
VPLDRVGAGELLAGATGVGSLADADGGADGGGRVADDGAVDAG